ncbi:MAG: HAMP domain-containing sensor histidine kinase [Chloroflexota bacterium]
MSIALPSAYRPVIAIWSVAFLSTAIAFVILSLPAITVTVLMGSLILATLVGVADYIAARFGHQGVMSAAPTLIITGVAMASWPLTPIAVLSGTAVAAAVCRQHPNVVFRRLGARLLIVAVITPIYDLMHNPDVLPFSTGLGVLSLLIISGCVYTLEYSIAAGRDIRKFVAEIRSGKLSALRWYIIVMVPLGGILALLWAINPWMFFLGLAPLFVAQHVFRIQADFEQTTVDLSQIAQQREDIARRLERLLSLTTTIIGTRNVQKMLELICERLAGLLDAPYGWVVLFDERDQPQLKASYNLDLPEEVRFNEPDSYAFLLKPVVVTLLTDERQQGLAPMVLQEQATRWSGVLTIPLTTEHGVLGAICLVFEQLRGLEADEQRILTSFARQASMMLENAQLFDEVHQQQAELVQSSKLAALGTFSAGIAHEFNNLLGGIIGYAELGKRVRKLAEKNEALDVIMQSCWRGSSITRSLLTFAREERPRRELANITETINETLTLVAPNLRKDKVKLVREIDAVPDTVCDVGQIAQVVLNLVTNARDAMKPDGGTLTVSLQEQYRMIELQVSDTGCGIPKEMQDKIFDPFVTTKGTPGKSHTSGTGLGLSISYGIVQEHGGVIKAQSVAGQGTTMIVSLPITSEIPQNDEEEVLTRP